MSDSDASLREAEQAISGLCLLCRHGLSQALTGNSTSICSFDAQLPPLPNLELTIQFGGVSQLPEPCHDSSEVHATVLYTPK